MFQTRCFVSFAGVPSSINVSFSTRDVSCFVGLFVLLWSLGLEGFSDMFTSVCFSLDGVKRLLQEHLVINLHFVSAAEKLAGHS